MFETYLIEQRVDPQIRRRFTFALGAVVVATVASGALMWAMEKMHVTRVGAPTSDYLVFALDQVEPPPPPAPPAAPSAAPADPPDEDTPVEDIMEDPVQPTEVPDDIPNPRKSARDVLSQVGGGGDNPFGVPGGDPNSKCVVGCGPVVKVPTAASEPKAPREVDFSALGCRVCPDPDQKALQHTSAALMGKHGVSNKTRFCVESSGKVSAVTTARGSGDRDVDRIIKETVRAWRFAPMLVDGRARKACSVASFDIRFE